MTARPCADYVFTAHARFQMARRGLSEALVERVLQQPGQRWEIRPGRDVLQSRISVGEPEKQYLVRVVVDVDRTPNEIVTAYRTSKLTRYWRQEP